MWLCGFKYHKMYKLTKELYFPNVETAHSSGIVAFGGDLSTERLILAYKSGIFPWFEDGEEIKMTKDELKLFESKLLLKDKNLKLNTNDINDDNDDDKRLDGSHIKLYKCSDESGTLKVTEKKAGPLIKTDLESEVS